MAKNTRRTSKKLTKAQIKALQEKANKALFKEIDQWMRRMNQEFAVVNVGGSALVTHRFYNVVLKRWEYEDFSFDNFRKLYDKESVVVGRDEKGKLRYDKIASAWLKSRHRRQYDMRVFDPEKRSDGDRVMNLWTGFAVKPKKGDWSRFRQHLLDVICAGNREHFDWLMGWLARAVQFPGRAAETAIVLKGIEGTGKGIVANTLGRLFGEYYLHVHRPDEITGRFNASLETAVLCFADEATFAGDPKQNGALKAIITEPTFRVEQKYLPARTVANVTHLIFASNNDWVIPAGPQARRFFVLNVSSDKRGDRAYFKAIADQMDDGGLEAMLYDLRRHSLRGFNYQEPPQTAAMIDQKIQSLRGSKAWLLGCLEEGVIGDHRWTDKGLQAFKKNAYSDYLDWSQMQNEYRPATDVWFWRGLREMLGEAYHESQPSEFNGQRLAVFATLPECRAAFAKWMQAPERQLFTCDTCGGSADVSSTATSKQVKQVILNATGSNAVSMDC